MWLLLELLRNGIGCFPCGLPRGKLNTRKLICLYGYNQFTYKSQCETKVNKPQTSDDKSLCVSWKNDV